VERDFITLTTSKGETEKLPYGVCVWSTGEARRWGPVSLVSAFPVPAPPFVWCFDFYSTGPKPTNCCLTDSKKLTANRLQTDF
jgi:hypothetical protein